ncbi:MAG: glycosyltransferase family 4 protein [Candidatus Methanoperedens sp.]|nr:glycosyltransferase family 4 protein [Candidatus Methanoperedens sp.]
MKILMTSIYFPCVNKEYEILTDRLFGSKSCGGAESFVYSFIKEFSDHDIEIELFAFNPNCKGITVKHGNIKIHYFNRIFKVPFLHGKYIPLDISVYQTMFNNDLIHCQGSFYHPLTALVCLLKIFHRKPVIISHHATQTNLSGIYRLRDILGLKLLRFADRIVIPSENSKSLYEDYTNKIEVIPLGTVIPNYKYKNKNELRRLWGFPEDRPIILFVGHLAHYKGVFKLIEAFKEVKSKLSEAMLIISGDGPDKENLIMMADRLGLKDSVVFLGRTIHSKIFELYSLSDLLVFLSIKDKKYLPEGESFGMVIIEAMFCGLPVVSTKVGAPRYIVEPSFGVQVNPIDINEIANAILITINNKTLVNDMGKNAIKIANKKYKISRVVDDYINLYKNLA